MRRLPRNPRSDRGFALVAFLALFAAGVLYYVVSGLAPSIIDTYRNRKTQEAMAQARDALVGYALQYRDQQIATGTNNAMYGFLPMPDVGKSRFHASQSPACNTEGCAMNLMNGAFPAAAGTIAGRFPWRTLGIEPLRDGNGECLWYVVSAGHKSLGINPGAIMNWDTPGQLDVVVTNNNDQMRSLIANPHDRPIAVVFSPGKMLAGQSRASIANGDVVDECGGNYEPANYVDPNVAGTLLDNGGTVTTASVYYGGARSTDTSAAMAAFSTQGVVQREAAGTLWPNACPSGGTCTIAANDSGLALTPDMLFNPLRRSANFRTDINSMLDRMVGCLRDQVAAGGSFVPTAIAGYVPPADKSAGRIPANSCYDDTKAPLGYFTHWQDMFFVATPTSGMFTVNGVPSCAGVLAFANQRNAAQRRSSSTEQSTVTNYLELAGFTSPGTTFSGPEQFDVVSPTTQTTEQDIVRCIPNAASFVEVQSPALTPVQQLVDYDPGSRTLTLGKEGVTTTNGVAGGSLFGCAWTAEADTRGNGFRAYFTFRFKQVGTSVGSNGFVFAAIDAIANGTQACGAAGSHLGYSGNNGVTPPIAVPKVGIEFDQSRNAGFSEVPLIPGRADPPGGAYNSHAAIVYWGHSVANATDGVTLAGADDNVHGFPTALSQQTTLRPAPQNPADLAESPPGIAMVNLRGQPGEDVDGDGGQDSYLYHVRIEVTRSAGTSQLGDATAVATTNVDITSPGATIGSTNLASGNRVLLAAQTDAAENGVYVWHGPASTMNRSDDADTAAELSNTSILVATGSHAGYWRQPWSIVNIGTDAQNWQTRYSDFQTQVWIERDSGTTAQIRAAMQNTTRPMALLYPGYAARLSDTATLYDVAGATCGAGCPANQTCGTDNLCYRPAMHSVRLGFTGSQYTQDQQVIISNFFASWLQ
jgi:hypothetical protein